MTPLERAARDRLGAFLGARPLMAQWTGRPEDFGDVITSAWPDATENAPGASLYESDLRLLLAALDRHEQVAGSVLETARQVAEHAGRFGPVPERVEITYQQPIPASALAWAREQAEQAAAKYEQWADLEANPALKTCMQFAARVMRAEFLGQDGDRGVNGRFTAAPAAQPLKVGE